MMNQRPVWLKFSAVAAQICLWASLLPVPAIAQSGCDGTRYLEEIFSSFTLTSDVTYGSAINLSGSVQSLELDIREPAGDTGTLRPLIVMAHGGSFMFGDKTQSDIVPMAETFARLGYVTASIEYRLGMEQMPFPGPDSTDAMEAVLRAVADAKAALRFFYKSAANGNPYGIDTNYVFFMGSSAGAFIGIHCAYLDQQSEVPAAVDTSKASLSGGLEGKSGNPGYSSRIHAVISFSGAIGDTNWIEAGDVPILSLHGTADDVVPYSSATIVLVGVYPLMEVDGSSSVHLRAQNLGISNCFYTFPGAAHVPYVSDLLYLDTTLNLSIPWLASQVCGGSPVCGYVQTGLQTANETRFSAYPSPFGGLLMMNNESGVLLNARILDYTGKFVWESSLTTGSHTLDFSDMSAGIYYLRIGSERGYALKKLIKL